MRRIDGRWVVAAILSLGLIALVVLAVTSRFVAGHRAGELEKGKPESALQPAP